MKKKANSILSGVMFISFLHFACCATPLRYNGYFETLSLRPMICIQEKKLVNLKIANVLIIRYPETLSKYFTRILKELERG